MAVNTNDGARDHGQAREPGHTLGKAGKPVGARELSGEVGGTDI